MRTFWNLNREFETQIDLTANKWFVNFDSKAKAKCVPCGPWIIFELNTKCVPFWSLKTDIGLAGRKWFANFDTKAKAKWVPFEAWINFQVSPKMQAKRNVLRAESFCSRCAKSLSSFCTKFNTMLLFEIRIIIICKTSRCFCKLHQLAKFFRAFCILYQGNEAPLEFRLYVKVELVAAETAKWNILNRN